MKKYLVETLVTYRMRYVVEADSVDDANDFIVENLPSTVLHEFSQKHISEDIFSTRRIKSEEYLKLFDEDNGYLKSWKDKEKFDFINKKQDEELSDW